MTIRSGFFNSVNGDRKYDANRFAEYFATFIGNGVFPNPSDNLQVIANDDMTVTVKAGKVWINGYILINDDDYILNIEPADGVLNRIDRIVARYDVANREIRLEVKQGSFASSPVAPSLQRDADAYELGLADIAVNAGVISISQSNITDLRLNGELCGVVHGTVDQVDTTSLFAQYASWYTQATGQAEIDIDAMLNQFMSDFNSWYEMNTTAWGNEFDTWFANIKGQLEGDIAANLASQVTDLQTNKADKTYVDNKVKTDVPENAVFTDTNTTYTEITTAEIDAGTASTQRTITGRRVKYILDSLSTTYAASSHSHSGSDIISGTIPFARLPTGTSSSQVAIGDHTHSAYAASSHTHTIANVTNLQTTLNGKAPSVLYGSTVPSSLLPGQIFVKI